MKSKIKISIILSMLICLVLFAVSCTKKEEPVAPSPSPSPTEAIEENTPTPMPTVTADMRDISSLDLLKEFHIGINIGNSLDATAGIGLLAETSWRNPKISKELVQAIHDAGFDTVRIPVSWGKNISMAPDYIILEKWMDRVQEVVDYAYDLGMYVILNTHHEDWLDPSSATYEKSSDRLKKMWEQIAVRFRDYDEHLLFESLNEPRNIGTSYEWTGGNKDGRDAVNKLNKDFYDTVRATGGNNTLRHLIITTYGGNGGMTACEALTLPSTTDDKIIVNVHAYIPYGFALNANGTDKFNSANSSDTSSIDELARVLKKCFVDKGIAVMVNEFGSLNKNNTEARADNAFYYVSTMKKLGIPCYWWDNGDLAANGNGMGIINRRTCEIVFPEIVSAMMSAAYGDEKE